MQEAKFYTKAADGAVVCGLCAHGCHIADGKRGICGVRENRRGTLYSLVYGLVAAANVDPIEKKPLYHFLPGSSSYSIATVGCNFKCLHCQNYHLSQYPAMHAGEMTGREHSAADIVAAAVRSGCRSISYTYIEPTIFLEFAQDCAMLAREQGLKNVFVSNGYMSQSATYQMAAWLDAINVDLKAFSEEFYHRVCKARLQPVLENIRLLHELGIWLEVTTLVIPGLNDTDAELRDIARFIGSLSVDIPWHVSGFFPTYRMQDRPPTDAATLYRARDIGLAAGLRHVYVGNLQGTAGNDTSCPECGAVLIRRTGKYGAEAEVREGCCPRCGHPVAGVW